MRGGVFYPRWLPNLGFGYGYPVLNYYAPLTYYVAELFHTLGVGYIASVELTTALGFFLSGIAMYLYAKELLGRWPAVVAAVAYIYLPYHLADAYVRGGLTEFCAFVFLPLILWAFHRLLVTGEVRYLPLSSLLLAGLVLTHNLTAFLFMPVLIAYLLLIALRPRARALLRGGLAIFLGFGLSAFYWLPAWAEVSWIRAGQVGPTVTEYRALLLSWQELISPSPLHPYLHLPGQGVEHPIGLVQGVLTLFSLVILLHPSLLSKKKRWVVAFFGVVALAAIFMRLSWSQVLWDRLSLLRYLQFPWRLQALVGLGTSVLTGALLIPLEGVSFRLRVTVMVGFLLVILITSLVRLSVVPIHLPDHEEPLAEEGVSLATMAEYDYQTALWARLWGGPWLLEYLPIWVSEAREEFFLPLEHPPRGTLPSLPEMTLGRQGPLERTLKVKTEVGFPLSFHIFYFPNWRAYIDGKPRETYPSGPLGLLTIDVPPGEHEFLLRFGETPAGLVGLSLSLVGGVICLFILVKKRTTLTLVLAGLLLFSLPLLLHLKNRSSVEEPRGLEANLGNEATLLGYYLERDSYRPGEGLNLTLYWLALSSMEENYKVFVHLTDEKETDLIAQNDRWPVYNFSPTTRWQPGEIVVDRYEIEIPPDTPTGVYRLLTGMYLVETMENLPVWERDGTPMGNRILLQSLSVER